MLAALGHDATAAGVARIYAGLASGFVIDDADAAHADAIGEDTGVTVHVLPTVMRSDSDRSALASALGSLPDRH
jgi:LPPG:FO 2-phospho-L-lactate transferase